jgi:hypothetical protein
MTMSPEQAGRRSLYPPTPAGADHRARVRTGLRYALHPLAIFRLKQTQARPRRLSTPWDDENVEVARHGLFAKMARR